MPIDIDLICSLPSTHGIDQTLQLLEDGQDLLIMNCFSAYEMAAQGSISPYQGYKKCAKGLHDWLTLIVLKCPESADLSAAIRSARLGAANIRKVIYISRKAQERNMDMTEVEPLMKSMLEHAQILFMDALIQAQESIILDPNREVLTVGRLM